MYLKVINVKLESNDQILKENQQLHYLQLQKRTFVIESRATKAL